MSLNIKLIPEYYENGEKIFAKKTAIIEPGITILVGCNGTGKTTFLNIIEEYCRDNKIKYLKFNSLQDTQDDFGEAAIVSDIDFMASSLLASEGERIVLSIGKFARKIGAHIRNYRNEKRIVFLIDSLDSGFSIDNIVEVKDFINKIVLPDYKNSDIEPYFILSANSYELTREERCFDVASCKYVSFVDYDNYRNFILDSRKKKEKRRKNNVQMDTEK